MLGPILLVILAPGSKLSGSGKVSIKAQILSKEIKHLIDLLLVTRNKHDIITIHGAIRLKLESMRGIIDAKSE